MSPVSGKARRMLSCMQEHAIFGIGSRAVVVVLRDDNVELEML
jgi:hypothetical protein